MVEVLQMHNVLTDDIDNISSNALIDHEGHSYNANNNSITSLMKYNSELLAALDKHKRGYRHQIHDLKMMLKETAKCNRKVKSEHVKHNGRQDNSSVSVENEVSGSNNAVAAVFADILLQARMDLGQLWEPLGALERDLFATVLLDYRKVCVHI